MAPFGPWVEAHEILQKTPWERNALSQIAVRIFGGRLVYSSLLPKLLFLFEARAFAEALAMKRVLDLLKDASIEQRSRVKEAVQTSLQDGSLQVEYVVKEKNAKILQLEQERHRLKDRLAQMERLTVPLGGDAANLMQQKDGEMLALQTGAKKVQRAQAFLAAALLLLCRQ